MSVDVVTSNFDVDDSAFSIFPEKTTLKARDSESGQTVRCSDISMEISYPDKECAQDLEEPSALLETNEHLKRSLLLVTAERDALKEELNLLKLQVGNGRDGSNDEETEDVVEIEAQSKVGSSASSTNSGMAAMRQNFRTSFRLPSFMVPHDNGKIFERYVEPDSDSDLSSLPSSIGVSSNKSASSKRLASNPRKRSSFIGRIFGGPRGVRSDMAGEKDEAAEIAPNEAEFALHWERNHKQPKAMTKDLYRRPSLMKRIFGGRVDEDSKVMSERVNDKRQTETRDQIIAWEHNGRHDKAATAPPLQPKQFSARSDLSKEESRSRRESMRMSKNFMMKEEHVEGLKSCLRSKCDPNTKQKVKFRESVNEVKRVSKIRGSAWDNCFFTEEELADFKYEAFMEECGLTDDDF